MDNSSVFTYRSFPLGSQSIYNYCTWDWNPSLHSSIWARVGPPKSSPTLRQWLHILGENVFLLNLDHLEDFNLFYSLIEFYIKDQFNLVMIIEASWVCRKPPDEKCLSGWTRENMGCLYVSLAQWISTLTAHKKTDWLCLPPPPALLCLFSLVLSLGFPGNFTVAARLENHEPKFNDKGRLGWYHDKTLPESSVPVLAKLRGRMNL